MLTEPQMDRAFEVSCFKPGQYRAVIKYLIRNERQAGSSTLLSIQDKSR